MLKKISHKLFGLCGFAGFMLAVGTAGSSDCELISLSQMTIQCSIAVVLMLICYFGLKLTGYEYVD